MQKRVLRSYRRIVESGRDRMRLSDLPVRVLQHVTHRALQHTGTPAARSVESRCVLAQLVAAAARFDTDHAHCLVVQERMKQADRIRAAADARHEHVRQPAFLFENLCARFASDDALKIAHHERIRMWSKRAAEQVVVSATFVTQSRNASLIASFKVREPALTSRTSAPSNCMRKTL